MEMQAMAASETKSGKSGSLWRPTEKRRQSTQPKLTIPASALRCRRKFLRFFPGGFADETYVDWERGYKWQAHERWMNALGPSPFRDLLRQRRFSDIAAHAVSIESRTNLLFSFEKMALRDAVKSAAGAEAFATGLYDFLHGRAGDERRFEQWCEVVGSLPRRQTRVLTWPVVTVFGFLAQPDEHFYLKPTVTRRAAEAYGYPLAYERRPSWSGYAKVLDLAAVVKRDLRDLRPRDMIDIQSFLWVQGSDEYPDP
jgi:hypothetical protein